MKETKMKMYSKRETHLPFQEQEKEMTRRTRNGMNTMTVKAPMHACSLSLILPILFCSVGANNYWETT